MLRENDHHIMTHISMTQSTATKAVLSTKADARVQGNSMHVQRKILEPLSGFYVKDALYCTFKQLNSALPIYIWLRTQMYQFH